LHFVGCVCRPFGYGSAPVKTDARPAAASAVVASQDKYKSAKGISSDQYFGEPAAQAPAPTVDDRFSSSKGIGR
jgi:hypothetical protein